MLSFRSSKALVEVKQILFPCLFGIGQPLVDAVKSLADEFKTLVGKFIDMVETLVHALYELTELLSPYVLLFSHDCSPGVRTPFAGCAQQADAHF